MPKNKKDKKPTIANVMAAVEDLAIAVNKGFTAMDEKFEGVDEKFEGINEKFKGINEKLDKKPDKSEIFAWGDKQVIPLGIDVDKLKYIHRHELKSLPDTYEISRALVEEGLKKRKK